MPIQMFGARVSLPTFRLRTDVFLVAGLYDTPLLPAPRLVGLVRVVLYFGLLLFMSRSRLAVRSLISQRGLRSLDAAHHGRAMECERCEAVGVVGVQLGGGVLGALEVPAQIASIPVRGSGGVCGS